MDTKFFTPIRADVGRESTIYIHIFTDRREKFRIHRRLFRPRVAVQPGKVRKRERLGRWCLRRPALPFSVACGPSKAT